MGPLLSRARSGNLKPDALAMVRHAVDTTATYSHLDHTHAVDTTATHTHTP
jgi:hypothetical protein